MANGDRVTSLGLCRAMAIRIGHEDFTLDCYAKSLDGFDVILGVQWLGTLGPITWDFSSMTMSFARQGRRVTGTDLPMPSRSSHALTCSETNLLDDLLDDFADLFVEPHGLPPVREISHHIHLKRVLMLLPSDHTVMHSCKRTSLNVRVQICFNKEPSVVVHQPSLPQSYWSRSWMVLGVFVCIIAISTTKRSKISFLFQSLTSYSMSFVVQNYSRNWTYVSNIIKC